MRVTVWWLKAAPHASITSIISIRFVSRRVCSANSRVVLISIAINNIILTIIIVINSVHRVFSRNLNSISIF